MARTMEQIIPHLLGGISKQPPYLRGIDQSVGEENTNPTFAKGLLKRPCILNVPFGDNKLKLREGHQELCK